MSNEAPVVGIVLAAGASTRMGRPKALLRCGPAGETFVARLTATLAAGGITDVIVVGRPGDDALRAEVGQLRPPPSYVVNSDPERGQLSSLIAGIDRADAQGAGAVIVVPVDTPLITPPTIAATLTAFRRSGAAIARATHGGRHGHPVVFRRDLFAEIRAADPAIGARIVLHADPARVVNVEVTDAGVLRDVDYPEDYRQMFAG